MFLDTTFSNGNPVRIITRTPAKKRLLSTCFRGKDICAAGNFIKYKNTEELFQDRYVLTELLAEIAAAWRERSFGTNSITIEHTEYVGYESTLSLTERSVPLSWLEDFEPNHHAQAKRIKLCMFNQIKAPLTRDVTIVFELKNEDDRPTAVVHSIYPGCDIGEISGDVTSREHRVFFDWEHPGEILR